MKTSLLNNSLAVSAVVLLAANIYLRFTPKTAAAKQIGTVSESVVEKAAKNAAARNREFVEPTPARATSAIHWAPLETDDYPQYMANLGNFGFPEELIRQMITDEIDALYAPRIDPLRTKPIPHDAPVSERNRWSTAEDIARLRELQKVLIEKRDRLEELLGGGVPREMIRTPVSRNYEAYEYAVSQLPPEKQEAVRVILENNILADDENIARYGKGTAKDLEGYAAAQEVRIAELKKILTPAEMERLDLNFMAQGTELQREIIGMEATDEELLGIFRIADEQWKKNGGVFSRWRAKRVPAEQIKINDQEAESKIEQLFGADRYVDYRMARSDTGRQLNNLAARYDVSRENIRQAYRVQSELDQLLKQAPNNPNRDAEERQIELATRLNELLGPIVLEAWQSGRNQKYKIEP
jgi:hypothetical protein